VRETSDKFAHVYVHSATVADTRLSERGCVKRENGYALHRKVNLPMGQNIPV
jgi:hypothetical protein